MSTQEELITNLPNPSELSLGGIFGEINQLGNKIENGEEVPPADRARLASLMNEVHGRHNQALAKIDEDYDGDYGDKNREAEVKTWLATIGPVLNHIDEKAALWGFRISIGGQAEAVADGQAAGADEAGVQVETSAAAAAAAIAVAQQARAELASQVEPQLAALRKQQEELNTTIAKLQAEVSQLQADKAQLTGEKSAFQAQNTQLTTEKVALEARVQTLETEGISTVHLLAQTEVTEVNIDTVIAPLLFRSLSFRFVSELRQTPIQAAKTINILLDKIDLRTADKLISCSNATRALKLAQWVEGLKPEIVNVDIRLESIVQLISANFASQLQKTLREGLNLPSDSDKPKLYKSILEGLFREMLRDLGQPAQPVSHEGGDAPIRQVTPARLEEIDFNDL